MCINVHRLNKRTHRCLYRAILMPGPGLSLQMQSAHWLIRPDEVAGQLNFEQRNHAKIFKKQTYAALHLGCLQCNIYRYIYN